MVDSPFPASHIVDAALARADSWLAASRGRRPADVSKKEQAAATSLAALLHEPGGVDFAMAFVDQVARPADDHVAAKALRRIVTPVGPAPALGFLSATDSALLHVGTLTSGLLPTLAIPAARRRLRQLLGHLVFDADGAQLRARLRRARESGVQLNLNLLGEAVLGQAEADARLERTHTLLREPAVDYVSIKVSSVVAQLAPWDFDGNVDRVVARLRPLYRTARDTGKFVNLDMEEYKDLHLTIAVFTTLLAEAEFRTLTAGIVLQAYLPDAQQALEQLTRFGVDRVARGGAPIKVRLVKGANLAMEHVDADQHHWPLATYATKADVDANYLAMLDAVLTQRNAGAIRIGVASQNLFTLAYAVELAEHRGVQRQLDIEMLQGMAPMEAAAVRADVGSLILYTPVVRTGDFDVAVSYLVRRLEENASSENFLYSMFSPHRAAIDAERDRFRDAVARSGSIRRTPNRVQDRACENPVEPAESFCGEPDSDPSTPANRHWAAHVLARPDATEEPPRVHALADIDAAVARARAAQPAWAALPVADRSARLDRAAAALAQARGELLTTMIREAGKTVAEADPEISEAIDFARYYARSALTLDALADAAFTPHRVVVVTPPWNFPVAIAVGGILAALAAGAAVIVKPAPQAIRCSVVAVAALHAAGIPVDALQLVHADEAEAGMRLITHPDVDAVVLTGASDTAAMFRRWRPDLTLLAETSGKNAMIVTPAADPDLAVSDLVRSAFGHAGQKCSAASLLIAVGSVGQSTRFFHQLVDAVRTLTVGESYHPGTAMGPLIEPAEGKLLRGLTRPAPGERWLIEPRRLDEEGRLWSPGVLDGVAAGSWFHTTELFGPVLGIMRARTLDQALELQNSTGYGLTAGLHSLDPAEIEHWQQRVEAGNLYVNRHMTGAIVQRQPFGGWKRSSIGPGAKAGGPNYVAQFGHWADRPDGAPSAAPSAPTGARASATATRSPAFVDRIISSTTGLSATDSTWLRAAAASDQHAWEAEFAVEHDPTALRSEANIFRYRPLPHLSLRITAGAHPREWARIRLAAARTGTRLDISVVPGVAPSHGDLPTLSTEEFAAELRAWREPVRLRLLGEAEPEVLAAAAEHEHTVIQGPVLLSGRRELLTMLREQALSITRHRYGHLSSGPDA